MGMSNGAAAVENRICSRRGFFVDLFKLSTWTIMSSVNKDSIPSSFPTDTPFLSLSFHVALDELKYNIEKKLGNTLVLYLILGEKKPSSYS